jgi:hypothetical protein
VSGFLILTVRFFLLLPSLLPPPPATSPPPPRPALLFSRFSSIRALLLALVLCYPRSLRIRFSLLSHSLPPPLVLHYPYSLCICSSVVSLLPPLVLHYLYSLFSAFSLVALLTFWSFIIGIASASALSNVLPSFLPPGYFVIRTASASAPSIVALVPPLVLRYPYSLRTRSLYCRPSVFSGPSLFVYSAGVF